MWTKDKCLQLDASDKLAKYKDEFYLPPGTIYLDGNSLGALPKAALARSQQVIQEEWGKDLVKSWNNAGWFEMPARLGSKLAKLLGANPEEMVVTDTISINVFKTVAAALMLQKEKHPNRKVIVAERDSFPSDLYMIQGMLNFLDGGYELRLFDDEVSLEDALTEDVAVLEISEINYRTGYLQDMKKVTELAHSRGILTVWDLAHSAGAVNIDLNEANADFAVGCTYKFLNAGPGAPGFAWAASRHLGKFWQPLSGWWGHAQPFLMAQQYRQAPGGRHFLCGTQPIVSLALVECGLDIFLSVDMNDVRKKSLALSDLFIELVAQRCAKHDFKVAIPKEHHLRGSHVSLLHPEGYAIVQALISKGVIGDYREPQILRFGLTPLYLSYTDIWNAVELLAEIMDNRLWDKPEFKNRNSVT